MSNNFYSKSWSKSSSTEYNEYKDGTTIIEIIAVGKKAKINSNFVLCLNEVTVKKSFL